MRIAFATPTVLPAGARAQAGSERLWNQGVGGLQAHATRALTACSRTSFEDATRGHRLSPTSGEGDGYPDQPIS
jgi:hypothetical protein